MIIAHDISKIYGDKYIFSELNLHINKKDKLGIVGENGVGKSTLMECLYNDELLTDGYVEYQNSTIGYIKQSSTNNISNTVYEELMNSCLELKIISEKIKETEKGNKINIDKYIELENKFNDLGGYDIKNKFLKFLIGFSFTEKDLDRKLSSFSGGEKTKIELIKILLQDPDYLFLDEPTNHLDIDAIEWLENYLKNLDKSIVLISHDQQFLENICNSILEINKVEVTQYKMKLSKYLGQRELNFKHKKKEYQNNQKEIKRLEEFIVKNSKKPSKIGQVNDRKKKIFKLEEVKEPIELKRSIKFKFEANNPKKNSYIQFKNSSFGYDKVLIEDFSCELYAGDKVFLTGANGVGKTTLFKSILKKKSIKGHIKIPKIIKIGYFDQEQKNINPESTIYELIEKENKFESNSAIRKYLAQFNFLKDDVFKKVKVLSGGEKVRVALSLMGLEKYDVLLMDEPTNHLDLDIKEILIKTLKNFEGVLFIISHDRYLINQLATKTLYITNKKIKIYDGNWNNVIFDVKEKKTKKLEKVIYKKESKKINEQKLQIVENEIIKLENQQNQILEKFQDNQIIKDSKKQKELTLKLKEIELELIQKYEEYS